MDNTEINDIRTPPQFKGISFSKYKKSEVRNQIIENMIKGKLEPACYWCAELICAGHFMEVWEIILHYMGKHIHLGNPKLVIYLESRFQLFRVIMSKCNYVTEIQLRNNDKMRQLFAEIICTLTLSNRNHSFEPVKINRTEEFDMTQMTDRLIAPNMSFGEVIYRKEDPKELFIAVNEFIFNIVNPKPNLMKACYWIEWMIEFGIICKTKKQPCFCERRTFATVENKYQKDIIWLLWDFLLTYSENKGVFINKLMKSILTLFCIKYTTASSKKRRYLLYFAVGILIETVPTNIEIINNKPILQNVLDNIGKIYKQIKKNEESPNTDYLFNNLDKQNAMERSMKKMDMLQNMDNASRNTVIHTTNSNPDQGNPTIL